jgi:hypothetical protein
VPNVRQSRRANCSKGGDGLGGLCALLPLSRADGSTTRWSRSTTCSRRSSRQSRSDRSIKRGALAAATAAGAGATPSSGSSPSMAAASFQSCRISAQEPTFTSALRVSGASVAFNCATIPTIDLFLSSCLSLRLNFTLEFLSITQHDSRASQDATGVQDAHCGSRLDPSEVWFVGSKDRASFSRASLWRPTMVFSLPANRAASVGALEASGRTIFRQQAKLGPASRIRLAVSIPVPSRLFGGGGH